MLRQAQKQNGLLVPIAKSDTSKEDYWHKGNAKDLLSGSIWRDRVITALCDQVMEVPTERLAEYYTATRISSCWVWMLCDVSAAAVNLLPGCLSPMALMQGCAQSDKSCEHTIAWEALQAAS